MRKDTKNKRKKERKRRRKKGMILRKLRKK